MSTGDRPLARALVRHRIPIALAWATIAFVLAPRAARIKSRLDSATRIEGSESAAVEDSLAKHFWAPFAHYAVLVIEGAPPPGTPEGRNVLAMIVDSLRATAGVTGVFSYLDSSDTLFIGARKDGMLLVTGTSARSRGLDEQVVQLRATARILGAQLRPRFPRISLQWTGDEPLQFDLGRASGEDIRRAELRALPLTLLLLMAAFGAVVAAILPVAIGVLAIAIALGAAVILPTPWPLAALLQNVASILGLGLGIDYALLMVSRFREALDSGDDAKEAAMEAAHHAGPVVLLSGSAVAIGFLALLAVPLDELRSVALGGLLVVLSSVLLATTLLPGLLSMLGTRIDFGRVRRRAARGRGDRWRRWGEWVTRHPWVTLAAAGLPMLALAAQTRRLNSELPQTDWIPPVMESAQAWHALERMQRGGFVQTIRVLVHFPQSTRVLDVPAYHALQRLSLQFARDPRIVRVRALPAFTAESNSLLAPRTAVTLLPDTVLRSLLSSDEHSTLIELLPRAGIAPKALTRMVRELRAADAGARAGFPGVRFEIGGFPAHNVDYEDVISQHFGLVVGLVLAGTFITLLIGFGSVAVPLKAIVLNLLSVAAAFGAAVIVFQDGIGARAIGLASPVIGLFPDVPILVFCTVFGLSMDYEVFLVARVRDARRSGLGDSAAIAEGLALSGPLITRAAAIMVAVFGAFAMGALLPVKMLGFTLATAVVLDATVVRVALGPALLRVAGRWNWWPAGFGTR